MTQTFLCEVCRGNHATWEHGIYMKIKLVEMGVPLENIFIIPDEETGDTAIDKKIREIENIVEKK